MKDHFYIVNKFVCYKYVVILQQKQLDVFLQVVPAVSAENNPSGCTN